MLDEDISKPDVNAQQDQEEPVVTFTKREAECVIQAVRNKSLSQIAKKVGIKERTVYFYLVSASNKLKALCRQILHKDN